MYHGGSKDIYTVVVVVVVVVVIVVVLAVAVVVVVVVLILMIIVESVNDLTNEWCHICYVIHLKHVCILRNAFFRCHEFINLFSFVLIL